jgi:hypothetical protein
MKLSIKRGFHTANGRVISIEEADNGLACGCTDLVTGEVLEAVQGPVNDWHFRRYDGGSGAPESILHKRIKDILCCANWIDLPTGRLSYSLPAKEKKFDRIQPDVTVKAGSEWVFFEIYVTSTNPEKDQYYRDRKMKSFEMDATDIPFGIGEEDLWRLVLEDVGNKRIIFWPEERPVIYPVAVQDEGDWVEYLFAVLIVAVLAFLGWRYLKRRYK